MTVYIGGVPSGGSGGIPAPHAGSHVLGGGDTIDGDHVDINFVPEFYGPVDDSLSGHLHGIDHTFSGLMVGDLTTASNVGTAGTGVFKQKSGVDLEFKKLNAASVRLTVLDDTGNSEVKLDVNPGNVQHNALSGIGTDDHHAKLHNQFHLPGGTDPLVGDAIGVAATPVGYSPASAVLSGHLVAIGTALSEKALATHAHIHDNLSGLGTDNHHAKLHNTTHMADGVDPINTDLLTLAVNPSGYTRDSVVLSGHLIGISTALTQKASLTHTHLHNNLSGIGTDDHHAKLHNQSHLPGGTDPLVGDAVGVAFAPTNYTAAAATLSGHLVGINTKLGLAGAAHNQSHINGGNDLINTDLMTLAVTPSGYTKDSSVLSGHLTGIGTALTQKASLVHTHLHDNLSGINTDNHHAKLHNQSHIDGGNDLINTDLMTLAVNPSGYTRESVVLSGHLNGISTALTQKASAAHTHLHNNLSGIGANDHHNQLHNQSHLPGGSDPLVGDALGVALTPVYYTPTSNTLSGHLKGIDNTLSGLMVGDITTASNVGTAGTGVFKQKVGVDLQFKKVNAASVRLTVADDIANSEVKLDVNPGNIQHNALSGIGANDHHPQLHNQSHIDGGNDLINTDLMTLAVNPAGYVRDSVVLSGHLTGISTALTQKASAVHTHLHNNLSGIGVNDHHAQLHNQNHLLGGIDPLNGSLIPVAYTPTNYTPFNSTLSGQLSGLDWGLFRAIGNNGVQVYYVGKHGNDANDGLTPARALLTFTTALARAAAQTPSTTNRFVIVGLDAGVYSETTFTMAQWVSIDAPNAVLVATNQITLASDSNLVAYRIERNNASGYMALYSGSGSSYLKAHELGNSLGSGIANIGSGTLDVDIHEMNCAISSVTCGFVSGGKISGRISNITNSGASAIGLDIEGDTAVIDLVIGRISLSSGTAIYTYPGKTGIVNLVVDNITAATAYNIGAGGTLNIFVNSISGTETATGTVNIDKHQMRAHNQSHLPGGADPIVGDALSVAFASTNYTAAAATLSGHLAGINTKFGTLGGSGVVRVTNFASPYNTPPVPASGNLTFNISGIGTVGLAMHRFQATPSGAVSSYCVEMYRRNTFFSGDLQYLLSGVTESVLSGSPTLDESIGQMYDDDLASSLHVRIANYGSNAWAFALAFEGTKIDS